MTLRQSLDRATLHGALRRWPCTFALVALALALPVAASAQRQSVIARADSIALLGDTDRAIAILDSLVHREPKNAPAWNHLGLLAWSKAKLLRRNTIMDQRSIDLVRMADTSLRLAQYLAPDSGRYNLELGRNLLWEELVTLRLQAPAQFERAIKNAQKVGDSALVAEAADELGMVYWREYEAVADRRGLIGITTIPIEQFPADRHAMRRFLDDNTQRFNPPTGELNYTEAVSRFTQALQANPLSVNARKHAFMALADQGLWEELRHAANVRAAAAPYDPLAFLALGLASHRLGIENQAKAAFDSALVLLPEADRKRYTNIARILKPDDSSHFSQATDNEKLEARRVFWTASDPLLLAGDNIIRLEFLSRVAFSELRWTSEDLNLKGADTDRGQIYIRYGPPGVVASFPPTSSQSMRGMGIVIWYYPEMNIHFVFQAPPSYGTAQMAMPYINYAEQIKREIPATWTNLKLFHAIDSIPMQVVRFRAGDSSDVAVYADVPVAKMVKGIDLARGPLQVAFFALDPSANFEVRDSSRQMVDFTNAQPMVTRTWRHRLAAGTHSIRVEALQPEAGRAARAIDSLVTRAEHGFGMSDVLVAERITAPDGAARWSDVLVSPSSGVLTRRQSVSLLWETYDLAASEGGNKYRVDLTLERSDRGGLTNAIARIISGTAGALVGRGNRSSDRITLSFNRSSAARSVALDYLTLDLKDLPAGAYRFTIGITDLANGKTTSRSRAVTIVE
jgi:GWxTD domain-containing protein